MAESEETTENVEEAPATEAAAASEQEPTSSGTRKERNAAARAAKAKPAAGPKTLEQRLAERQEHRERNARQRRAYRAKQKAKRAEARSGAATVDQQATREHGPGRPKVRTGIVTSAKPDKTITVRIDVTRRHQVYKKIVRSSSTLHVHDEKNDANEGDLVRVIESRPLSRTKRWRLVEVLERSR
jgi:small subunit ribosomal protein S17